jgi:aldose sugar dehydrogenase
MTNKIALVASIAVGALCLMAAISQPKVATPATNYKNFCSSCHGDKVEMFVDRKWKHGNTRAELIKSITNGYPDNGMPSWGAAIAAKDIEGLADLILKGIEDGKKYAFNEKPKSNIFPSDQMTVKLDTIASGLNNPWGMVFLPDNDMIVTDRTGKMYRITPDKKRTAIEGVPEVVSAGQGGLLDVELHPKFAENGFIYLSYSAPKQVGNDKLATTAIMRAKLEGNKLTDQKVLFEAVPASKTRHHYGSRLAFDKDGYLFFSVGDRGNEKANPQSLESDCGKIHRIKDDGTIPADNPYVGQANARPSIYSWGHRNPQGLAIHPTTGQLWEHEHGPRGGDELNIVQKAKNYGWPVISYGINYDGTTFTNITAKEGMEQPQKYWIPSIGPCGTTFVTGERYKAWKGNLLVGSLRFKYLNRCVIKNDKVVKEEILLKNIGRLRFVEMGRDGYIYVGVEDPGLVYRLMPM